MSTPELTRNPWTARRWIASILMVLAVQLGLVFWLTDAPEARPSKTLTKETRVRVAVQRTPIRATPDYADPTLFALVTPQGFSGPAWLTIPPFQYRPTNTIEPLHWLGVAAEDLASEFSEFVQTNLLSDEVLLDDFRPLLAKPAVPRPVVTPGTKLRIEGQLAAMPLLPNLVLPQQPDTILTNSVVQLAVSAAGLPISATLLSGSGVAQADRDALQFASEARFAPAPPTADAGAGQPSTLVFGTLVFQWARVRWEEPPTTTALR